MGNSAESSTQCSSNINCYCGVDDDKRCDDSSYNYNVLTKDQCEAYTKKINLKFQQVNSNYYAPGCYKSSSIRFNIKKTTSATCGKYGMPCVCGKPTPATQAPTEAPTEAPTAAPTVSEFKIAEKGVCGKSVSKETCQNEASKNGLTVIDVNNKSSPKGCSFDHGIVAFYYNSAESSTQCSSNINCYCGVDEDKEDLDYEEIDDKRCDDSSYNYNVLTKDQCEAYAKKINLKFQQVNSNYYAPGCYKSSSI